MAYTRSNHAPLENINFHKLALTRGSSYIELPGWITKKRTLINPKDKDEEGFKWTAIAALHHKETRKIPKRISKIAYQEYQYNWQGLEFLAPIQQIVKFEKSNLDIKTNKIFTGNNYKTTAI